MRVVGFKIVLGALLALAASPCWAQANCQLNVLAELPVTMSGLRPLVPVKINGHDLMLTADSGAFFSTLSVSKANELQLHKTSTPPNFQLTGVAGFADSWVTRVDEFQLANIPLKRVEFLVAGLSGDIGAGLLGQNVLGLGDVEYDLPHGAIRLWRPKECANVSLAYWAKDKPYAILRTETPNERNRHTRAQVQVNGHTLTATFDTGAGTTVISRRAAAAAGVNIDDPGVTSAGVSGGVGAATTKIWRASFASFKVGDEEVRNLKLFITDRLIDNDMLLGADFFISHRVLVSNSQHRIYLTYEGGPVFNSAVEAHERDRDGKGEHKVEASLSAEADPTDADGFSRRGMAAFSRNEIDKALADLNKAVDMAPQEPRYLLERARIQAGAKKVFLAMADLDAAIRLKPDEVDALIARARLKIGGNDAVSALTDLDAASRVLPKQADARLTLADMYDRVDKPDLALMQADLWVENHPDNPMLGHALNTRCWARAILGVELDKALHDCDRAVNLQPRVAAPLVNRGLVHLRRQEWQAALKDDEAALAINPRAAWALYGRGTARARLGEAEAGEADVKAAHALWSRLDEQIKRYNLAP